MQEAEAKCRKKAAEYPKVVCGCPWGTPTHSEVNPGQGQRYLQRCNACGKLAEYRLRCSSDASQIEHNRTCTLRANQSDRIFNRGAWQRLDGKPYLKHSLHKLETQADKRRRLAAVPY